MARSHRGNGDPQQRAEAVLDRFGQSYADEAGIKVRDQPSSLFQLLCFALLSSARIRANIAATAARALFEHGWTSPGKLAKSSWEERTKVLNQSGYARYDERTSTMLADTTDLLFDRWGGDLRRLREEAGRDPAAERRLLQEFKGIGPVGADIFAREVQAVWPELYPTADKRSLEAAQRLGLGDDPQSLAELVDRDQFPHLVDGLVRIALEKAYDKIP